MLNVEYRTSNQILIALLPGRVAQSVKCLAKDASLTADPGVATLNKICLVVLCLLPTNVEQKSLTT